MLRCCQLSLIGQVIYGDFDHFHDFKHLGHNDALNQSRLSSKKWVTNLCFGSYAVLQRTRVTGTIKR